jgi:hypothetical protein
MNWDALGLDRGHRTLTITRKGDKIVTIPLAPRVARALHLAIGERVDGPIFVDVVNDSAVLPPGASCVVSPHAGIASVLGLIRCGTRSSPLRSTPEFPYATSHTLRSRIDLDRSSELAHLRNSRRR